MTIELEWSGLDGSHWGLSDWYPGLEQAIRDAIDGEPDWTTGWYASKHEIASARITCEGNVILVEASVSDDFDTVGRGDEEVHADYMDDTDSIIDKIRDAISTAWQVAEINRQHNRLYSGFTVLSPSGSAEMTYIAPRGMGHEFDSPPGDFYFKWGWQEDDIRIHLRTDADKGDLTLGEFLEMEQWAQDYTEGEYMRDEDEPSTFTTKSGWTIRPWRP